jgi:putative transposase
MGLAIKDDGWRLSDELWAKMEPLLPVHEPKPHPLGCHRRRVPDRAALNAILFVLRTGCQWNALNATGICSSTTAYRRFRAWLEAGVFERFWRAGLLEYDRLKGIDWSWLAVDGALTKAPLGGEKNRPQPHRPRQRRRQAKSFDGGERTAAERGDRGRQPPRHEAAQTDAAGAGHRAPGAAHPQGLCLDRGYDYDESRALAVEFGYTAHIRTRGEEAQAIKHEAGVKARRWVVERAHSWLNRFRRLLIRWEKRADTYLAMLHLALGIIAWRAALLE